MQCFAASVIAALEIKRRKSRRREAENVRRLADAAPAVTQRDLSDEIRGDEGKKTKTNKSVYGIFWSFELPAQSHKNKLDGLQAGKSFNSVCISRIRGSNDSS